MARKTEGHVIVCGYGIVGSKIVEQLLESSVSFVVVDTTRRRPRGCGARLQRGGGRRHQVLGPQGGRHRGGKAIAVVLDNDAKNLFAVITARDMRKDIFIATRANDEFVKEKLIEAGANHIVMPQVTASKEILKEISKMRS